MTHRDIIVIGASAGGLDAIGRVLSAMPENLEAAIFIVLHTADHSEGLLPAILSRTSKLVVTHPQDGEEFVLGRVYIAPPGKHMMIEEGFIRVIRGPRENLHRPAIDPLFRSAAVTYGPRVIGVVLTGMLDDGTSGLMIVGANGGRAIVEDPQSAQFSSMPQSALDHVPDAQVAALADLPATLLRLVAEEIGPDTNGGKRASSQAKKETRIAEFDLAEISKSEHPGRPSPFACPECGGVLWEVEQNGFLRFRCRVGHALTAKYLVDEQRNAVESALWEAMRALEESASLHRKLAERARVSRHDLAAASYEVRASETESSSRILRDFLLKVNKHENGDDSWTGETGADDPK